MSATDRSITIALIVAAIVAWIVVAIVFTTLSPVGDAGIQLLGSLALGVAVGLTVWPLLWSARGRPQGGAPSGTLAIAARRAMLIGLVVTILVVLRALEAVALPLVVFLVVTAVLIEVAFTLRR